MHEGLVEATRYPRNPLDVLAQQIVAIVGDGRLAGRRAVRAGPAAPRRSPTCRARLRGRARHAVRPLPVRRVRRAAAARHLGPRARTRSSAREGAKRVAIANAGTIPDRGLYGVFLAGAPARRPPASASSTRRWSSRARAGETFLLGASTLAHRGDHARPRARLAGAGRAGQDAVLERRAARAGRSSSAARSASSSRELRRRSRRAAALARLDKEHASTRRPPRTCCSTSPISARRPAHVPDDRTIVIERCRDELGDWRVCLLSPFGGRVHAPWAMAVARRLRDERRPRRRDDVDRRRLRGPLPGHATSRPIRGCCCPTPTRSRSWCCASSARRRCSPRASARPPARALLLPRRRHGGAHAAVAAAQARRRPARGRGAVRLVPDPARDLPRVPARRLRPAGAGRDAARDPRAPPCACVTVDSHDAVAVRRVAAVRLRRQLPLRRRRAAGRAAGAGAVGRSGAAPRAARRRRAARAARSRRARRRRARAAAPRARAPRAHRRRRPRSAAAARRSHAAEIEARVGDPGGTAAAIDDAGARRGARCAVPVAGEPRLVAVEDAAATATRSARRCRRACRWRSSSRSAMPLLDLVRRYARTHGPFTAGEVARRFGARRAPSSRSAAAARRRRRAPASKASSGPAARTASGATPSVLRQIRRRSLAGCGTRSSRSNRPTLGRLSRPWQGVTRPRRGLDALLDAVETLQGAPLVASVLEREILPARDRRLRAGATSTRCSPPARWCGRASSRSASATAASRCTSPTHLARLWRPPRRRTGSARARRRSSITCSAERRVVLRRAPRGGRRRLPAGHRRRALGPGLERPGHQRHAAGAARLRRPRSDRSCRAARCRGSAPRPRVPLAPAGAGQRGRPLVAAEPRASRRSRRPSGARRWRSSSSPATASSPARSAPPRRLPGGFSAVYDVLRALEESGRVRRGFFVGGLGATQFALPPAPRPAAVAAPAARRARGGDPRRRRSGQPVRHALEVAGARGGRHGAPRDDADAGTRRCAAARRGPPARASCSSTAPASRTSRRGGRQILTWLPEAEPERSRAARALSATLAHGRPQRRGTRRRAARQRDRRRARARASAGAVPRRRRLRPLRPRLSGAAGAPAWRQAATGRKAAAPADAAARHA